MEKNLPVIAKSIRGIVRVVYFMLRKGISNKRKVLLDLNLIIKRGKIAGKAISNLMFHHHHHHHHHFSSSTSAPRDYEFSCSNTPNYCSFHLSKRRHHNSHFFTCAQPPQTLDDDVTTTNAHNAVLELLNNEAVAVENSPALPGFGKSPMVRQLRIIDSPFPLNNVEEDTHVDEAAEKYINKFYKDLRQQQNWGASTIIRKNLFHYGLPISVFKYLFLLNIVGQTIKFTVNYKLPEIFSSTLFMSSSFSLFNVNKL